MNRWGSSSPSLALPFSSSPALLSEDDLPMTISSFGTLWYGIKKKSGPGGGNSVSSEEI